MRLRFSILAVILCCLVLAEKAESQTDWPSFGNDPGAMRYSPLNQINTGNVTQLKVAWQFDTSQPGAAPATQPAAGREATPEEAQMQAAPPAGAKASSTPAHRPIHMFRFSESIPIVIGNVLYMSTAYRQIIALDAETGEKIWQYDSPHPPALRGISYWPGTAGFPAQIVYGTLDGWLISIDAKTGKPSSTFGDGGLLDLKPGAVSEQVP